VFFSQIFKMLKSDGHSTTFITTYLTAKNHTEVNVKSDPLAFFFTISNYGVWLPGDSRGWIEYKHGWLCTLRAGSKAPDPTRKMESINPVPPIATGHRTSNPTRKRGSTRATLNGISHRRPYRSHDRTFLSCREWNKMLGRVLTLPPLRFGLLADTTDCRRPSDQ